jgi:hypothetical protein
MQSKKYDMNNNNIDKNGLLVYNKYILATPVINDNVVMPFGVNPTRLNDGLKYSDKSINAVSTGWSNSMGTLRIRRFLIF